MCDALVVDRGHHLRVHPRFRRAVRYDGDHQLDRRLAVIPLLFQAHQSGFEKRRQKTTVDRITAVCVELRL